MQIMFYVQKSKNKFIIKNIIDIPKNVTNKYKNCDSICYWARVSACEQACRDNPFPRG